MSATVRTSQQNVAIQGMIAPGDDFVEGDGALTPVSFRFLWGVYQSIAKLQAEVATLQQRLANAGIP